MVDTFRGRIRIRAWPRKRGPSKSTEVQQQNAWFKAANLLAKKAAGPQIVTAMEAAKGTGLYPRDIILRAMGVGLFDIILPGGELVTYRQGGVDPVAFQGAILELAVAIPIPANTTTLIVYPLPLVDTALFWDIANPTRLTIPTGVTIVRFTARTYEEVTQVGQLLIMLFKNGAPALARVGFNATAWHGETLESGAIQVVAGDYFEMGVHMAYPGTADANGRTHFSVEILEAT